MTRNILFISGSFGLGHVIRDLEIANELRNQIPDTKIFWIAGEPALSFLIEHGETIHPKNNGWIADTDLLENISKRSAEKGKVFHANAIKYLIKCRNNWKSNVNLFDEIMKKESYDLVVGDETYELSLALRNKITITPTFVIIFDFIGADAISNNPVEKLIVYKMNYEWVQENKKVPKRVITSIFIGEPEDVPDKRFGFLLPNRRASTIKRGNFVGYILHFDPKNYEEKYEIRKKPELDSHPLIVCSVGGTSIGLPLLELCCKTFPLIKNKIPGVKMILVAGPRISSGYLKVPEGVIVKEYLPDLYEYFAACDLAVVQAGSSTTLELVALKKPFIYFPVEGHFEQQLHVVPRLERFKAGVKMQYSKTTPEMLAEKIIANIGLKVNYPSIPLDGAKNTVKVLRQIIEG